MRIFLALLVFLVIVNVNGKPTENGILQPQQQTNEQVNVPFPILSMHVYRHASLEQRALIKVEDSIFSMNDGGLATKGAERAHYATLAPDNTWKVSSQYCSEHGGDLCPLAQVCNGGNPVGADEIPNGIAAYSPVKNGDNQWVQLTATGEGTKCAVVKAPTWGASATKMADNNKSKSLVPCCKGDKVLRSYLVPDGAIVDPALAMKLKAAEDAASRASSSLQKLQTQINTLTAQVVKIEAANGASTSLLGELRDALQLKGNSPLVKRSTTAACCGHTPIRGTPWVQYTHNGIYVDVTMAKCGFKATPAVVSSMSGFTSHWVTIGTSSIYSQSAASFRVYIHGNGHHGHLNPSLANQYGWAIQWCAAPAN
jgi:hypothetical protein